MANWNERFKDEQYIYGTALRLVRGSIDYRGRKKRRLTGRKGLSVSECDYAEYVLDIVGKLAAQQGLLVNSELVDLAEAQW